MVENHLPNNARVGFVSNVNENVHDPYVTFETSAGQSSSEKANLIRNVERNLSSSINGRIFVLKS